MEFLGWVVGGTEMIVAFFLSREFARFDANAKKIDKLDIDVAVHDSRIKALEREIGEFRTRIND